MLYREMKDVTVDSNIRDITNYTVDLIKKGEFIDAVKFYLYTTSCTVDYAVRSCRRLREEILKGKFDDFNKEVIDPSGYIGEEL